MRWLWYACLFVGVMLTLWIPPFQSPDEPNHFLKAWHISEGHFLPEKNGQRVGGTLPISVSNTIDYFAYLKNNPEARISPEQIGRVLALPLNPQDRDFQDFANTAMYAPLGYAPQAVAIAAARYVNASPLFALYAARLANFLLWWWLVGSILKKTGDFKWFFLVWAALPATLVMAASANPDVLMNALAWWCIAFWVVPKFQSDQWFTLSAFAALCLQRLIAWPLALLVLLKEKRLVLVRWLVLGSVAALIWSIVAKNYFIPYDLYDPLWRDSQTLNSGVNPDAQMDYVWHHPMQTAQTLMFSGIRSAPAIVAHVTVKFGWEKNYLHWILMLLCCLSVAGVASTASVIFSRRERLIILSAAGLYLLAFALTNYLLWHRVGASEFHNWQGRYFTPVLPLMLAGCSFSWLRHWQSSVYIVVSFMLLLVNLALLWAIGMRYWQF